MVKPLKTFLLWRQFVVWLRNILIQLASKKLNWKDVLDGLLKLIKTSETLIPPVKPPKIPDYDLSGGYVEKPERRQLLKRLFEKLRRHRNG